MFQDWEITFSLWRMVCNNWVWLIWGTSSKVVFPGQVLSAMGRLSPYGDVHQRLFETLHFVKVVVLGSPSDIKEACMRVRLLHAAIRYHLCHRDGGWEIEKVRPIYHPFHRYATFGKQNTCGNVSKVSISLACYRQIRSKSTNHSH